MNISDATRERFWSKVEKTDGCWLWRGAKGSKGYGTFRYQTSKTMETHRLSFIMERGAIGNGLLVCHSCDVKLCVNPAHLWLGTVADNARDYWTKRPTRKHPCRVGHDQSEYPLKTYRIRNHGRIVERQYCTECIRIKGRTRYAKKMAMQGKTVRPHRRFDLVVASAKAA